MICYQGSPHLRMPVDKCVGKPHVIRVRGFSEKHVHYFRFHLQEAIDCGQPIIPIVIDSYGGSAYGLFAMIDLLESAKAHATIATVCEGKAMSAGAGLLSCGQKGWRYVGPNSCVMVHEGSGWSSGKVTDHQAETAELRRITERYFTILAKNCGKPRAFFERLQQKLKNADAYLDASQAIALGVADHIGLPQLGISVEVNFGFGVPQVETPRKKRGAKRGRRK